MKKIIVLTLAVALFATACNSEFKDIKVAAESETGFSMTNYETYAWLGSAQIMHDELGQWEPPEEIDADVEIRSLIDKRMTKQKMKIDESNPDLIIGYAAGIDLGVMVATEDLKSGAIDIKQTPKGALLILFIDARTGDLVWLGQATANVKIKPKKGQAKRRLNYAVKEMFKLLPE